MGSVAAGQKEEGDFSSKPTPMNSLPGEGQRRGGAPLQIRGEIEEDVGKEGGSDYLVGINTPPL